MAVAAGRVLGGTVRLERSIGSGAMGEVWLATHLRLGSQVAVKVMRDLAGSPEARARFQQEARAAAQLGSPFAVQVLDCGVAEGGEPFVVMELLRGQDLKARLDASEEPLGLAETVTIVDQICRALARAHEMGIVHRDVKPANVFLVAEQGSTHVKLLDFGVAKLAGGGMHMTSTGGLVGTPYYMSPEQLFHPSGVDHRADLWAVAVVAYACLARALPFQGETVAALSVAMHRGSFLPLRHHRPDLPPAIDAWMARALAPSIDARFRSAAELAEALRIAAAAEPASHWSGPPVGTTSPSGVVAPVLAHGSQPRRSSDALWVLGSLFAVALLALGALGAYAALVHEAGAQSPRTTKEARAEDEEDEEDTEDPAPASSPAPPKPAEPSALPASPGAPSPSASASASPSPTAPASVPAPKPTAPKWRKRKMRCGFSHVTKTCAACCLPGDRLEPYPSCECLFDGEKWDREHGKAR